MRKQLLACAVLAVTMVPSLAGAALISIAVNEARCACAPTRVLLGTNGLPNNCVDTANFTSNVTGLSQPAGNTSLLLLANDITTTIAESTGVHTLNMWVTASGLTVPIANPLDVLSGLTQNLITRWMEFDAVDVSQSDKSAVHWDTVRYRHVYGYRDAVPGPTLINTGAGPYSVTGKFVIVTDGTQGQSNATIVMVPGPIVGAGLPGLIAACLGLFGLQRRRRRKQFAA